MGLMSKLGFGTKPEQSQITPIKVQLHPAAMEAYPSLVVGYLQGAAIQVLNPTTQQWEDCPNPVFDPQYAYRTVGGPLPHVLTQDAFCAALVREYEAGERAGAREAAIAAEAEFKRGYIAGEASMESTSVPPPTPSAAPQPACHFQRGDVVTSTDGKRFLVLANKYEAIPGYNPANDPDSGPLVVARHDRGVKQAVSCRALDGTHPTKPQYSLQAKGNNLRMVDVGQITSGIYADQVWLYSRNDGSKVRLCRTTGEIKLK